MREKTNIMLDEGLKKTLSRIAKKNNTSLSDQINKRLSNSLTLDEKMGDKPEWMNDLNPKLQEYWANVDMTLPEPLNTYQKKMDEIDDLINHMLALKEYFRGEYDKEVSSM
ncbi:hypothetical protein [Proteus mirabilis]|uniref:hypothetical protein n=1 Tax=Proteus mirabilis TaxID=584 RepID=UPI003D2BE730